MRASERPLKPAPQGALVQILWASACLTFGGAAHAEAPSDDGAIRTTAPAGTSQLNPTGRAIAFLAPLKDGELYIADVEVQIGADDTLLIGASALDALGRIVSPLTLAALKATMHGGNGVTPEDFRDAGLGFVYDPAAIEVRLSVPAELRLTQDMSVSSFDDPNAATATPARFSAYLNARAANDFVHRGAEVGWADPVATLDGAVRLGGVVLESEHLWKSGADDAFTRQGTRLVYDDTQSLVRWSLGDLRASGARFQSSPDIAGVGASRIYAQLAPQRNIRPRGERSFTLVRPSTVETIINGRTVARTRLDPGAYDARDFPFVDGANDVRLVITDDTGRTETVRFSIFVDRALLAPGLTEFGAFGGVRSELDGAERRYRSDEGVFSGFVRHGLSAALTAGLDLQADSTTTVASMETIAATPFGVAAFTLAASERDSLGDGVAANIGFSRLVRDGSGSGSTTISASIEARSKRFTALDAAAPTDGYRYEAGFTAARTFGDDSYVAVDVRYAPGWGGRADARTVRTTFGRRLSQRVDLNIDVFDDRGGGARDGTGVRVALARRFGSTGSVRADYDSLAQRASVSGQAFGGRGADAWNLSGQADRNRDTSFFNAAAAYYGNRGELGVAHAASFDPTSGDVTDERSTVRAAAALAFADGAFALGRTVHDSFAVFTPHRSLAGGDVRIDPAKQGDLARTGVLRTALVGDLGSYTARTLAYDAPSAPIGYDLGAGVVQLRPPYRSGYRIVVGSDYALTVIGRLTTAQGAPVALQVGKAIELAHPERPPVTVLTNREGRFGIQGLRPGAWRIDMPNGLSFDLDLTRNAEGMVRIGDVPARTDPATSTPRLAEARL